MIAIATGNTTLDRQILLKLKKEKIDAEQIKLRDDFLKENFDTAVISKNLEGELGLEQLLYYLRENQTRVIYTIELSNVAEVSMCFKYDIYDIVVGPTPDNVAEALFNKKELSDWSKFLKSDAGINIEQQLHDLQELREEEKKRFRAEINELKKKLEEEKNKDPVIVEKKVEVPVKVPVIVQKTVTKTIKQQVLTFYTTDNNLNKDEVLTNFAVLLAKKTDQKILVIDANMPTPNLDMLFGIHKEVYVKDIYDLNRIDTGISACYGAIEKGIFSSDMLKEFVIKVPKLKNLYVLTGVYDLAMFFKKLEAKHYEEIIEAAKQIYDTIIIDVNPFEINTATYAALLNSSRIIVTCEPNWANARNSLTIIKDLIGRLKIPKEKFNFVINNTEQGGLSKDLLCKIFTGFKILGYLPYNKYHMKYLNNKKTFITSLNAKSDIAAYMELIENLGYKAKATLFQRLFKKNDETAGVLDAESGNTLTSKETEKIIDEIKEDKKEKEGE